MLNPLSSNDRSEAEKETARKHHRACLMIPKKPSFFVCGQGLKLDFYNLHGTHEHVAFHLHDCVSNSAVGVV